jgi:hypothetical protein
MKETAWTNQGQLIVNDHPVAELPKRKKNHANNVKVNYTTRPTLLDGWAPCLLAPLRCSLHAY